MHKIIYGIAFIAVSLGSLSVISGNYLLTNVAVGSFIVENVLLILSGTIYFNKKNKIRQLILNSKSLEEGLTLQKIKLEEVQEKYKEETEDLLIMIERLSSQKEEATKEFTEMENKLEERRIVLKRHLEDLDQKIKTQTSVVPK